MLKYLVLLLAVVSCKTPQLDQSSVSSDLGVSASSYTLVGNIPGRYTPSNRTCLGQVVVAGDKIAGVKCGIDDVSGPVIRLTSVSAASARADDYDFIYPGLINMHNHNKQNHLPVWDMGDSQGVWDNRFEWRDIKWSSFRNVMPSTYEDGVGGNMNPWSNNTGTAPDQEAIAATFRWSELVNMAHGATYNQSQSLGTGNFSITSVREIANADETGDVVDPDSMLFFWREVAPALKTANPNMNKAVKTALDKYCADVPADVLANTPEKCTPLESTPAPMKTKINAFLLMFKKIVGRVAEPPAVFVVHLAEGRRDDPYNQLEYEFVKLLGLARDNMIVIHGVGIDAAGYKDMANRGIGLVWSPYSNLILYRQTADIKAAWSARGANGKRLVVALGSDWTPTGSKSVLEELKVAKAYSQAAGIGLTDSDLYTMVTENPAKMLKQEGMIGTLKEGAYASIMVLKRRQANAESNLVAADALDVNLVVNHGKILYGEPSYLQNNPQGGENEAIEICERDKAMVMEDTGDGKPDSYAEIRDVLVEATLKKSKNSQDASLKKYLPPTDQIAQLVTCPNAKDKVLALMTDTAKLKKYIGQTAAERTEMRKKAGLADSDNAAVSHNVAKAFLQP